MTSARGAASGRDLVTLAAAGVELVIDPAAGGRFSSLQVGGRELLVTEGSGPLEWGCYPMAPFAGRIREGRFTFRGRTHQLDRNWPPHAIHGTVYDRRWRVTARGAQEATLDIDLGPGWPFHGRMTQSVAVRPDGLDASLMLKADEPMPGWLGWHPWFKREVVGGASAELDFAAERMYARGPDGLPTGELVSPTPGPWDDAFVGVRTPIRLTWPGVLSLALTATADIWVVYDERPYAICVEPQTAAPDAVNLPDGASGAGPGRPLSISMSWRWAAAD